MPDNDDSSQTTQSETSASQSTQSGATAYETRRTAYIQTLERSIATLEREGNSRSEKLEEKRKELSALRQTTDQTALAVEEDHWAVWEPEDDNPLGSLLDVLEYSSADINYKKGTPWREGYELKIVGQGGLYEREDKHINIVRGSYSNSVIGNRDVAIAGDYQFRCEGNMSLAFNISKKGEDVTLPPGSIIPGRDRLVVEGDALYHTEETRMVQAHNVVINRVWKGPIFRFSGNEGIIIGGLYTRVHVGPFVSRTALQSGDVYGGAIKLSVFRSNIALWYYHSYDFCSRVTGAYILSCKTWVMPPGDVTDAKRHKHLTKFQKFTKYFGALCPVLEIGIGILSLFPMLLFGAWGLIKSVPKIPKKVVKKAKQMKPSNVKRVTIEKYGMLKEGLGIDVHS